MTQVFDAIVIGAGQAGPSLAGRLTAAGMKVALVERKLFGGTCVNTGCMPTKTLVASAYAAHLARRSAEYGIAIESPIKIDMKRVKARADAVSTNARTNVETWLRGMDGLTVIEGHARFEGPDVVRVDESLLKAPRIFINVGGRASVPDMPGIGTVDYLTNTSILKLDTVPRHLIVVGGSYIGLEFAQMYRRFGAEVTVIEMAPRLIAREDEDVSEAVREILTDEGIVVRTDATCIGFKPHADGVAVDIDCTSGEPVAVGSHVLLAVGRRPNTDDLGLDRAGVTVDARGYIAVDEIPRDECSRHLGPGRLQRPRRLHPYRLQRLRDRRRQSSRWWNTPGERPGSRLRALHRSAARARRAVRRPRRARIGPAAARVQASDDAGRARDREGRNQGVHEGGRRCRDEADPRGRDPGGRRRRGDPRHPRHHERRCDLSGPAMGGADPSDRLGTDPDRSRRPGPTG